MKNYRNSVATLALMLVLSTTAFAGIMHTDVAPDPTPTPMVSSVTANETGADGTTYTAPPTTMDTLTEVALSLLQSALTLL